jgi:phosphate:Na+ symporter
MNFSLTLVTLAGSAALLLWGVRIVQTGVQRAFGARLRSTLVHTSFAGLRPVLEVAGV